MSTKNCDPFGKCIDDDKQGNIKIISFKETKSKYTAKNPNKHYLIQYTVDDCLIKSNEIQKCDKLVIDCTSKNAYFVELKGIKLTDASNQLINSIKLLKPKLIDFKIHARIVVTKSRGDSLQNKAYRILTRLVNSEVKKGNTPFTETYK